MRLRKGIVYATVFALMCFWSYSAWADPLGDLDNVFDNISTYYSAPTYYSGPTRSGFSLGNFKTFLPNSRIVPLTVEPPDIRASCGGISVYGGGFSFINADKFVTMLQNIMNAAAGYFFEMAIEQLCPTCHNIMSLLRHASQIAQKYALDSCGMGQELAQKFGGKLLDHATVLKKIDDSGSDWIKEADELLEKLEQDDHSDEQATLTNDIQNCDPKSGENCITGNYVYEIVKNSGGSDSDAQVVMSLVGTYIWTPNADKTNTKLTYKPPLLTAAMLADGCKNADKSSLKGACKNHSCAASQIPVYTCSGTKCLKLNVNCVAKEDLVEKVRDSLHGLIYNKLDKRENVAGSGLLGVFYYTPIVKEMWNAVKVYPRQWRDPLLQEVIDTSSEAFVYLYLEGYLQSVKDHLINPHRFLIGPADSQEEQVSVIYKNLDSRFKEVDTLKEQSFEIVNKKIANLRNLLQIAEIVKRKNREAEKNVNAASKKK